MDYYLSIIRRAAGIIWKNQAFWIFGILAGCGSTNAGASGVSWLSSRSWYQLLNCLLFPSDPFLNELFGEAETTVISILLTIVPMLMVAAIPLSILGRIGVTWGTNQIINTRQKTSFVEIYQNSKSFFWRILLINIPVIIGVGTGFGYVSIMMRAPYSIVCMLPWLFVLLPLIWFVKVVFEITSVTLVIEDLDILSAFKHGWQIVKINIKDIVIMGFVLSLSDGVTSLLIGLPISLLVSSALSNNMQFQWLSLCLVIYFPLALLLGSFVRATIQSSWALTYLRMQNQ